MTPKKRVAPPKKVRRCITMTPGLSRHLDKTLAEANRLCKQHNMPPYGLGELAEEMLEIAPLFHPAGTVFPPYRAVKQAGCQENLVFADDIMRQAPAWRRKVFYAAAHIMAWCVGGRVLK